MLHLDPDVQGIERNWLLGQLLEIRPRQGGERLKLAANRPARDMKSHYQTAGIPFWQRERLPFIFAKNTLLFAAGLGIDGHIQTQGGDCVNLRWEPESVLK